MEQWQCHRVCFFRSKLYGLGEIISGEPEEVPRHFKSMSTGKTGELGLTTSKQESKVPLEELMPDPVLLEKSKSLRLMNKAELCAYGRSLGIEFNADETTRAEMIRDCVKAKETRGITNQELADMTKG